MNISRSSFTIVLLLIFMNAFSQVAPTNGLVAYYPFNGNAGDSSGYANHAIVAAGASLTTDLKGNTNSAYYFNGNTNAYMTVSPSSSLNINAMNGISVAFWFKADTVQPSPYNRNIFQFMDGSVRTYELFFDYQGKRFLIGNWSGTGSNIYVYSRINYNTNTWYHVVLLTDSLNNTKLYVNGQRDTIITTTLVKPVLPSLYIGKHATQNWNIQGKIDEMRIYNRGLSQTEVSQLYASYFPPGLMAYYPFNGNAGDSSGYGNHGTVSGATLAMGKDGISNTAYYFDGVSSKITVAASPSLQPQYKLSLTAWIQPDAKSSAGWATVLTKRYAASTDPYNSYSLSTYNNDKWEFDVSNGTIGSQRTAKAKTSTSYNAGWIFLAATYDSTQAKLYVNGALDTVISFSGSIGYSINDLVIGYTTSGVNDYYKGRIDEIRIYNKALSPSEIFQLYSPYSNIYYSKSTGPLDSLSSWGTNTDGSGQSPSTFVNSNSIYYVVNNPSPTISGNWYITGTTNAVILGDGINTVNVTIPSGKTFGADTIYIRNNTTMTIQGSLLSNKPGFESGSTLQYMSSGTQNIVPGSYFNLFVSGGSKTVTANTTVKNTLAMLANINCGVNTLTIGTGISQTGTITYGSGVITGNLSRWFSASTNSGASSGLFPVGSTFYEPILIEFSSAPSNGGILTANFNSTNPGNLGLSGGLTDFTISPIVTINKAAPNGFWTITPSNGITGGAYTTTVTANGFYGINSIAGLRLMRRANASSSWGFPVSSSAISTSGTISSPVIARSGINNLGSDFGIGADSTVNPLPVTFLNFTAELIKENIVRLNWATVNELNNHYFEIFRSENNMNWTRLIIVPSQVNSQSVKDYFYQDDISNLDSQTWYYKLTQTDFDGTQSSSSVIEVTLTHPKVKVIDIIPNPSHITLNINSEEGGEYQISDYTGRIIYNGHQSTLDISAWAKGIYFISSDKYFSKFVVE